MSGIAPQVAGRLLPMLAGAAGSLWLLLRSGVVTPPPGPVPTPTPSVPLPTPAPSPPCGCPPSAVNVAHLLPLLRRWWWLLALRPDLVVVAAAAGVSGCLLALMVTGNPRWLARAGVVYVGAFALLVLLATV